MNSLILKNLKEIQPNHVLDVGCGCGSFTATLSEFCERIEAIDPVARHIERCKRERARSNITYRVMDATKLSYPDGAFEVVIERGSLHHIADWPRALREMIRVSSRHIFIEERVNDPRSEGKINGIKGQNLFLAVQKEVKYSHFPYILPETIVGSLRSQGLQVQWEVIPNNKALSFDEFFEGYEHFANLSERPTYWIEQREEMRREFGIVGLVESDAVFFAATKLT
jgi:SAM-dependent methyltransferase